MKTLYDIKITKNKIAINICQDFCKSYHEIFLDYLETILPRWHPDLARYFGVLGSWQHISSLARSCMSYQVVSCFDSRAPFLQIRICLKLCLYASTVFTPILILCLPILQLFSFRHLFILFNCSDKAFALRLNPH